MDITCFILIKYQNNWTLYGKSFKIDIRKYRFIFISVYFRAYLRIKENNINFLILIKTY